MRSRNVFWIDFNVNRIESTVHTVQLCVGLPSEFACTRYSLLTIRSPHLISSHLLSKSTSCYLRNVNTKCASVCSISAVECDNQQSYVAAEKKSALERRSVQVYLISKTSSFELCEKNNCDSNICKKNFRCEHRIREGCFHLEWVSRCWVLVSLD